MVLVTYCFWICFVGCFIGWFWVVVVLILLRYNSVAWLCIFIIWISCAFSFVLCLVWCLFSFVCVDCILCWCFVYYVWVGCLAAVDVFSVLWLFGYLFYCLFCVFAGVAYGDWFYLFNSVAILYCLSLCCVICLFVLVFSLWVYCWLFCGWFWFAAVVSCLFRLLCLVGVC